MKMKKLFFSLFLVLLIVASGKFGTVFAGSDSPAKRIVIREDQPIEGPLIKMAESITLEGQVNGDVYLFAGEVFVDAVINGDLIIAGAKVDIHGQVQDDLRVVGCSLNLQAKVLDNASIVGCQVTLDDQAEITNSLIIAGAVVDVNNQIGDKVIITAGKVRFNGQAQKDVDITAETIEVFSKANIVGNLNLSYKQDPDISDQAIVLGEITTKKIASLPAESSLKRFPLDKSSVAKKITALVIFQKLAGLIVDVLIGWLLIALLPKLAKSLAQIALDKSASALGWGFLKLILVPLIAVLLLISLIGIPLSVFIFMLYGFSLYAARLVASLAIGARLLNDKQFKKPYKSFILGLVIMMFLKLIPFIGWFAYALLMLVGLGSIALYEKKAIKKFRR